MRNWSKGKKCACATGRALNRTDSIEPQGMTIRQDCRIQSPIKTIVTTKFRVKYITETAPMPLIRINYYIYAERWKAGSGIGKGCFQKALALGLCILTTEDSEIFFSRIRRCFVREIRRTTSHHLEWQTRVSTTRRVGGMSEIYSVLIPHQRIKSRNINIHQSNWLTKWILLIQFNLLQFYRWY